jgi:hypothetical protein
LRHVLEHSYDWQKILDNAVASFTKRLCIVLFTPFVDQTTLLRTEPDYGEVPVFAFKPDDLLERIPSPVVLNFVGDETVIMSDRRENDASLPAREVAPLRSPHSSAEIGG